ncbi:MAG: 30S ribosomal protein S1 [Oscillospiraceae bacterium]|nr:30S ribosomal protein S1 [Oscillospiraceae bacterium]
MEQYLPEGVGFSPTVFTYEQLYDAMKTHKILQAIAVKCGEDHALHVDLGCTIGIIDRLDAALGIAEGQTRDIAILTRVGRPVCFCVTDIDQDGAVRLSRCLAQEQVLRTFLYERLPGELIPAVITNLTPFGAFCDVGCGVSALLPTQNICISRISHAHEIFADGQQIIAVIRSVDRESRRIVLSHRELLGTWAQNAAAFSPGQTVPGIVRSVCDYGTFIELAPNLSGLAETDETLPLGQAVSVYIKSIIPQTCKIKLVVLHRLDADALPKKAPKYYLPENALCFWRYGSEEVPKAITVF